MRSSIATLLMIISDHLELLPAYEEPESGKEAFALFTFNAERPGDLAFTKGKIILVYEKKSESSEW